MRADSTNRRIFSASTGRCGGAGGRLKDGQASGFVFGDDCFFEGAVLEPNTDFVPTAQRARVFEEHWAVEVTRKSDPLTKGKVHESFPTYGRSSAQLLCTIPSNEALYSEEVGFCSLGFPHLALAAFCAILRR